LLALGLVLALDFLQLLFGALDGGGDHATVELYLGLAGAAPCADTTPLALQVRPTPNKTRAQVLKAGKFDLQLAFVTARPLGEYFQNEKRPVIDRQLQTALQVPLLAGAQTLVKQNFLCAVLLGQQFDLIGLTRSHKESGVWRTALARYGGNRLHASSLR
jgi:hypothetical protein